MQQMYLPESTTPACLSLLQLCWDLGGFLDGRPPRSTHQHRTGGSLTFVPATLETPGPLEGARQGYQYLLSSGRGGGRGAAVTPSTTPRRPCFQFISLVCCQHPTLPCQPLAAKVNPLALWLLPVSPLPLPALSLQLIKRGSLLSEDKGGCSLHLGAPECQRCTESEKILAGTKPKHTSAGSGAGGWAAATSGDLSSFRFSCS